VTLNYNSPGDLSKGGLLAVHIVITVVLGLGILYGRLILITFRAPYNNIPPPRLVPRNTPLAVPPGNLPRIPGTPISTSTNHSSENASLREGEADDNSNNAVGLTTGRRSRQAADDETHVRFRSPLISAEGSFSFSGSDKDAENSLLLAAEASGLSFMTRVSPISPEHGDLGRESEPLRRRGLWMSSVAWRLFLDLWTIKFYNSVMSL